MTSLSAKGNYLDTYSDASLLAKGAYLNTS